MSNPHHQRNPALNGRSALRDTYPITPRCDTDEDILEDVELDFNQGSQHGSHHDFQPTSHQESQSDSQANSDGLHRHVSQGSSTFSGKRIRHSSEMKQYFQFGSGKQQLRKSNQEQQQTPESYIPQGFIQRPQSSTTRRPLRPLDRNPTLMRQRPTPILRRPTGAPMYPVSVVGRPSPVPTPTKKRWYARVMSFLSVQPSGAEANIRGERR